MLVLLFGFWMIVNGRLGWDVWVTGGVVSAALFLFSLRFTGWTIGREKMLYRLVPCFFTYACALLLEIAKANFAVMRVIFFNKPDPCIRIIETGLNTQLARVLLANSITLTPGTVTVQLVDNRITVHCLTRKLADDLSDMPLEKRLIKMEAKMHGTRV